MKYLLLILLALLLTGCGGQEEVIKLRETEAAIDTAAAAETTLPPETVVVVEEPELLRPLVNPRDTDFVRVKDYIPEAVMELKYAGPDNFTGQVIYEFEDVFLRYGTVMKLKAVAHELARQGLGF